MMGSLRRPNGEDTLISFKGSAIGSLYVMDLGTVSTILAATESDTTQERSMLLFSPLIRPMVLNGQTCADRHAAAQYERRERKRTIFLTANILIFNELSKCFDKNKNFYAYISSYFIVLQSGYRIIAFRKSPYTTGVPRLPPYVCSRGLRHSRDLQGTQGSCRPGTCPV